MSLKRIQRTFLALPRFSRVVEPPIPGETGKFTSRRFSLGPFDVTLENDEGGPDYRPMCSAFLWFGPFGLHISHQNSWSVTPMRMYWDEW